MSGLTDSKSLSIDDRGIKKLLGEETKLSTWLKVESALAQAQAAEGFIPAAAAADIEKNAKLENLDLAAMAKHKAAIGHGFVPFVKVLVAACSEEGGKYVHYGVTTQNIQQSSQLYIAKQVTAVFKTFLADILANLGALAKEYDNTPMAGRTHGRHAIPITFGYKVSVWISELLAGLERLEESEKRVFQVMMGGAVGGFNAGGPSGRRVQERVAKSLGMGSMAVPSRNISSHKTEFVFNLAMIVNALHKLAEEVYYTGLEEFGELQEGFVGGTVGSSTMPQKINPKLAKGIIANAQKLYSLVPLGLFSGARLFEADSSAYMLQENTLTEALELTAEVLMRAEELTRDLGVNEERMAKNLGLNGGLDNSEYVMMKIAEVLGKDKAHELLYELAMKVELEGLDFYQVLTAEPQLTAAFSKDELTAMIKPENYLGQCAEIADEMAERAQAEAERLRRN